MNWTFTCNQTQSSKSPLDFNANLAKNSQSFDCFFQNQNCSNQKSMANSRTVTDSRQKRGKESSHRAGDWICNMCSNHNYSFREVCNSCKLQTKINNLKESLSLCDNDLPQPTPTGTDRTKFKKKLSLKSGCQFEKMMKENQSFIGKGEGVLDFSLTLHNQFSKRTSQDTESNSQEASLDPFPNCPSRLASLPKVHPTGHFQFLIENPGSHNDNEAFCPNPCKDLIGKTPEQLDDVFCEFPFEKDALFSDKEHGLNRDSSEDSANESDSIEIDKKTLELLAFD